MGSLELIGGQDITRGATRYHFKLNYIMKCQINNTVMTADTDVDAQYLTGHWSIELIKILLLVDI